MREEAAMRAHLHDADGAAIYDVTGEGLQLALATRRLVGAGCS